MNSDDKPTGILSAAPLRTEVLDYIRKRDEEADPKYACQDRRSLLRHLDALQARLDALTAPRDRETLGQILHGKAGLPFAWVDVPESRKEMLRNAAEHLYALGAASRQGEIDALREERDDEKANALHVHSEAVKMIGEIEAKDAKIARLTDALTEAERHASDVHDMLDTETRKTERLTAELAEAEGARERAEAERDGAIAWGLEVEANVHRLTDCGQTATGVCANPPGCLRCWERRNAELVRERDAARAELAEARALTEELRAMEAESLRTADVWTKAAERLTAELAEARREAIADRQLVRNQAEAMAVEKAEAVATARAEGARDAIAPVADLLDSIRWTRANSDNPGDVEVYVDRLLALVPAGARGAGGAG